jgi:hypothetical protein
MGRRPKYGDATLSQILDVALFYYFLMTPVEYWHDTIAIGKVIFLAFHAYVERPNQRFDGLWVPI